MPQIFLDELGELLKPLENRPKIPKIFDMFEYWGLSK